MKEDTRGEQKINLFNTSNRQKKREWSTKAHKRAKYWRRSVQPLVQNQDLIIQISFTCYLLC